jgi:hypothetical protein
MRHSNKSPYSEEESPKPKRRKTGDKVRDGNRIWFRAVANPCQSLESAIHSIDAPQLVSVIYQTLVAIRLGQHRIKLKHHDMHLGNVMLADLDHVDTESWPTPEGVQTIKPLGLRVVLIDYGLSTAVDPETGLWIKRLDEVLLMDKDEEDSQAGQSWGVWGEPLENDEGYDAAMFIESMTEALFQERPLDISKLEIISGLQRLVASNFTDRGRPSEKTTIDWSSVFQYLKSKQ